MCTFAKEIWSKIGLQDIIPVDENVTVLEVLINAFRGSNRDKCALIGLFCWSIWFRRNTWVWNKHSISVFGVHLWLCNCYKIGDAVRSITRVVIIEGNKHKFDAGVDLRKVGLK